jgi:hypothetical protein
MMAVFWTDDIEREADRGLMVIVFLTSVIAPAQVFKKSRLSAGCSGGKLVSSDERRSIGLSRFLCRARAFGPLLIFSLPAPRFFPIEA